ncbi:MAG: DUF3592 domain-containing protein [Candidatus Rifleibacteriota bacterium]
MKLATFRTDINGFIFLLFSLPFMFVGFGLLFYGLFMFYTWNQSASWVKVPATVIEAKIKSNRSSKGSTTYTLTGRYRYSFNNMQFESRNILIEKGSSSSYYEKAELLEQMEKAIAGKITLDALVNPNDPRQALLFRKITSGIYLLGGVGLIFAVVGSGFFLQGLFLIKMQSKKQELRRQHPGQPWKADTRWEGFSVKTRSIRDLAVSWMFAVFFSGFVSIFIFLLHADDTVPVFAWVIIGIFAIVSIAFAVSAIYDTMKFLKFGESNLILKQIPLVPGKEFTGIVVLPTRIEPGAQIDFELCCEKRTTTGYGKNRSTRTEFIFSEKKSGVVEQNRSFGKNLYIPVIFQVPEGVAVDKIDANPAFEWKLKVSASLPGVDYAAEFSLPVFAVETEEMVEYNI